MLSISPKKDVNKVEIKEETKVDSKIENKEEVKEEPKEEELKEEIKEEEIKEETKENLFSNFLNNNNQEEEIKNSHEQQLFKEFQEQENIKKILNQNITLVNNEEYNTNYIKFTDNKFNLYDYNKQYIDSFSIEEILKYLSNKYDIKNQFLSSINDNSRSSLIEKYVVKNLNYNKDLKIVNIILKNRKESAFMADLELVINLNSSLNKFVENSLDLELDNVDTKYRSNIKNIVVKFNIILLNYLLELVELAMLEQADNLVYKDHLIKFAFKLVSKITLLVQEQYEIVSSRNMTLGEILVSSMKMRIDIDDKLNKIIELTGNNNLSENSNTSLELSKSVSDNHYDYSDDTNYVSAINKI